MAGVDDNDSGIISTETSSCLESSPSGGSRCRLSISNGGGRKAPELRKDQTNMNPISLCELSQQIDVTPHGDDQTQLSGICSLEELREGQIVMVESAEQLERVKEIVAAVIHPQDLVCDLPGIAAEQPRVVFAKILGYFHPQPVPEVGIHESATVDRRAKLAEDVSVGPFCVVGPQAQLGAGVVLEAFVVVGESTSLGEGCRLGAHAVVGRNCRLGRDCRLEPWAHLGDDVVLGDAVDLGAHCTLRDGVQIEPGAKLDNLVVVGARSSIGAGSLLVGQSAVDRDAKLHPGVILAGQASVGPEAELVSGVQVGGRALALGKLDKPGPYLGNPAIPLKEEIRRRVQERKANQS